MRAMRANGRNIMVLRDLLQLTQQQLADLVGCSARTIYNAEGNGLLRLRTLEAIAKALRAELHDMVLDPADLALTTSAAAHRKLLAEANEAVEANDTSWLLTTMHDDLHFWVPGPPEVPHAGRYQGKKEFRRYRELLDRAVEKLLPAVTTALVVEDDIAFWSIRDRFRCKQTDVTFDLSMCYHVRFRTGKIAAVDLYYDTSGVRDAFARP